MSNTVNKFGTQLLQISILYDNDHDGKACRVALRLERVI
jgi:hypothetical protein